MKSVKKADNASVNKLKVLKFTKLKESINLTTLISSIKQNVRKKRSCLSKNIKTNLKLHSTS